jgi:hypothetical protein
MGFLRKIARYGMTDQEDNEDVRKLGNTHINTKKKRGA